jgi:ribosomal protein L7/L12
MTAMEIHLAELMSDPSKKIQAIKFVREQTGFGLAEAKDYVEQRVWPAGKGPLSEKALEMQSRFVQNIIDRISTDYKLN